MTERIVIVGGTSGIGLATARQLAEDGYRVLITGRNKHRLENALATLPEHVTGETVDALDEDAMAAFFAGAGAVDHVVSTVTANSGSIGPALELTADNLSTAFDSKLLGYLATARAARPVLKSTGSLTFLSAISAGTSAPGTSALAAANAAVEAWARTLAVELAPLRVNVVSPGVIDTPWWGDLPDDVRQATFEQYAGITPVGRIGTANDVAQSIRFLIESPFTTGVVLPCDGGVRLAGPRL